MSKKLNPFTKVKIGVQDGYFLDQEFIEKQFEEQKTLMEKLFTQTELETIKENALGMLDALDSRHEFWTQFVHFVCSIHYYYYDQAEDMILSNANLRLLKQPQRPPFP